MVLIAWLCSSKGLNIDFEASNLIPQEATNLTASTPIVEADFAEELENRPGFILGSIWNLLDAASIHVSIAVLQEHFQTFWFTRMSLLLLLIYFRVNVLRTGFTLFISPPQPVAKIVSDVTDWSIRNLTYQKSVSEEWQVLRNCKNHMQTLLTLCEVCEMTCAKRRILSSSCARLQAHKKKV